MSILRCAKHDRPWDSDLLEHCPICEIEEATQGREIYEEAIKEKVMDLFTFGGPKLEAFLIPLKGLGEEVFITVGTRAQIASLIKDGRQ